jgi:hypothetical protein
LPPPWHKVSGRKARENLNRNFIGNRFPHRSEIISVLGVGVFVCYSWTIIGFFNKFSSFILYFRPSEIADIFAFMMAFALLESLTVTAVVVLLSALLPSRWLKEGFAFKGFIFLVVAAITAIIFQKLLTDHYPSPWMLLGVSIIPLVVIAFLIFVIHSQPKVQNILLSIQDRILILLFIYVPIGLISLIVVMYRNLL